MTSAARGQRRDRRAREGVRRAQSAEQANAARTAGRVVEQGTGPPVYTDHDRPSLTCQVLADETATALYRLRVADSETGRVTARQGRGG